MPVKSYLAYPADGKREELTYSLHNLPGCEIIPSENTDILVLVTDTPDAEAEKSLEEQLQSMESIKFLTLVSGYEEDPTPG
ncbi:hypothetical protein JNL27_04175 [bacterium]|nr:hypothetical protein [bacterium]